MQTTAVATTLRKDALHQRARRPALANVMNNAIDVRHEFAAYKGRLLSNQGFMAALTSSVQALRSEAVTPDEVTAFVTRLRRLPLKTANDMTLAMESLEAWCVKHQIILIDQ